jgi:cytochrome c-type biogenesis protein
VSATGFALAFGGGVVSFLSPCVLPLVPAYLSLTSGVPGRVGAVRAGALFCGGFAVVFVLLGLSATALGSVLLRQQVPVTRLAGVAVAGLAVVLALPAVSARPAGRFAGRDLRFRPRLARLGAWGAPVAGAAFGFGWTPCIGPVLGSVLAVAADQRRLGAGVLLLSAYAAGLAVPFLIAALALDRSLVAFRFLRRHSAVLALGSAAVLGTYGVLLAFDRLDSVTVALQHGMTTLGLGRLVGLG